MPTDLQLPIQSSSKYNRFLSNEIVNIHSYCRNGPFHKLNLYSCFNHRLCGSQKTPYNYLNFTSKLVDVWQGESLETDKLRGLLCSIITAVQSNTSTVSSRLRSISRSNLGCRFEVGCDLASASEAIQLAIEICIW